MRDVRNKFLAGIVERADAGQHLVECVRDQLCLEVIRNRNAFVEIACDKVNEGLQQVLADGTFDKLAEKYGIADMVCLEKKGE